MQLHGNCRTVFRLARVVAGMNLAHLRNDQRTNLQIEIPVKSSDELQPWPNPNPKSLTVFRLCSVLPKIFRSICVYQPLWAPLASFSSVTCCSPRYQNIYLGASSVPRTMQCSSTLLPAFTKRCRSPISSVRGAVGG